MHDISGASTNALSYILNRRDIFRQTWASWWMVIVIFRPIDVMMNKMIDIMKWRLLNNILWASTVNCRKRIKQTGLKWRFEIPSRQSRLWQMSPWKNRQNEYIRRLWLLDFHTIYIASSTPSLFRYYWWSWPSYFIRYRCFILNTSSAACSLISRTCDVLYFIFSMYFHRWV